MRSKTDLFQLIQAMSSSEKRYFTVTAQKTGRSGSKYLDLFNLINKMAEYDEAKIKKKFPKNLSTDKAYLYEAIMRSMRDYHSAKSKSTRLKELIIDAKYLKERGLYTQTSERLREAKELALEIDDQLALLEINREERDIAWISDANYQSTIKELLDDKSSILDNIINYFKYSDISSEMMIYAKTNFHGNTPTIIQSLKSRIDNDFESSAPLTQRKYFQSLGLYFHVTREMKDAVMFLKKVVDIWEENPKLKSEEYFKYVSDVSNLLSAKATISDIYDFPELTTKLKNANTSNHHLQSIIFQKANLYYLVYLINTGENHEIDKIETEIKKGLQQFQINIASRLALMFNVAILVFFNKKYKSCHNWSKDIIHQAQNENRKDVLSVSYLLNLIASYEFLEIEELEKEIRQTERFFAQQKDEIRVTPYRSIVQFVKSITYAPVLEVKDRLNDLKSFILEEREDKSNFVPLGFGEAILLWVEAKLAKKEMLCIIKEKVAA